MHLSLEKTFPRLWSINQGQIMVVTDLHGDWEAYRRYRDRFLDLHAHHKADCLLFTGDLIHSYSENDPDHSLEIVLDVLELQQTFGEAVIYLCGNHELPHIYSFGLSKGKREFTPAFEAALSHSQKRDAVNKLFISLPFFIRTRAGVSITHAGASPPMTNPQSAQAIFRWNHARQLTRAETELSQQDIDSIQRAYAKLSQAPSYDELARRYLAVIGQAERHLRLASGSHATPRESGQFLLFDAAQPVENAADLRACLHTIWTPT
jgi:hypothetical protein